MNEIIDLIKEKYDYEIGVINNGYFHKLNKPFKDNVTINIKLSKKEVEKVINKLKIKKINLHMDFDNEYIGFYKTDIEGVTILFSYILKSHTQVPKVLLKRFADKENLYILNTKTNKIFPSSASTYNRTLGFYSMYFEKYLSSNYEEKLGNLICDIESFVYDKQDKLIIDDIVGFAEKIFRMSLFRSPRFVKSVNENSLSSILVAGGYDHEHIAYMMEDMDIKLLKNMKVFLMVNKTENGFITLKTMISNIKTKGYECMIIPLDPKFALMIVPKEYYELRVKEHGVDSYMAVEDDKSLKLINSIIYDNAKYYYDDIIGLKSDLEIVLKEKNS